MTIDLDERLVKAGEKIRRIAWVPLLTTVIMVVAGCIDDGAPDVSATVVAALTRAAPATTPDIPQTVSSELTRLAPTATPSPTPTATLSEPPTSTPRPTPTATRRPTWTPTPLPTATATPHPRPTAAPRPTATLKPTRTPRPTATPRPTRTPVPTATPWPRIEYCTRDLAKFAKTEEYRDEQGFRRERDVYHILEEFNCTYDNGRTEVYISPIVYDRNIRAIKTYIQYDGVDWSTICETKLKCESKMGPGLWRQYWDSRGKRFDPAEEDNWSWHGYYRGDRTDWLRKVD